MPVLDPFGAPLLNTTILILSGLTITIVHHAIVGGLRAECTRGFIFTLLLAAVFTVVQFREYAQAPFNISDGIYGSTFFLSTGLHGLHVIVGTIFILVCFLRFLAHHFTRIHHVGFEGAA